LPVGACDATRKADDGFRTATIPIFQVLLGEMIMATAELLEFRNKVNASKPLQDEVMQAFARNGEGIVEVGKKHGYSFTAEEALELLQSDQGELSEFELELVAGGGSADCDNNGSTQG